MEEETNQINKKDFSTLLKRVIRECQWGERFGYIKAGNLSWLFQAAGRFQDRTYVADKEKLCRYILSNLETRNAHREERVVTGLSLFGRNIFSLFGPESLAEATRHEFVVRLKAAMIGDQQDEEALAQINLAKKQQMNCKAQESFGKNGRKTRRIPPEELCQIREDIKNAALSLKQPPSMFVGFDELGDFGKHMVDAHACVLTEDFCCSNAGFFVRRILRQYGLKLMEVPEILSESGVLINGKVISKVLKIRKLYADIIHKGGRTPLVGQSGYTKTIKSLPRSFYEDHRYWAPIEDLFDYLATEFYAGKRAGDAEDGAIGWLVAALLERLKQQDARFFERFSQSQQYWSEERLKQCLDTWAQTVRPALAKIR